MILWDRSGMRHAIIPALTLLPDTPSFLPRAMTASTVRTTVAFDPATAARLERLAKRWGVSKSETLRRALELSENAQPASAPDFSGMSPLQILDWLRQHPSPPIPGGWGDDPHLEMREMREMDAKVEDELEVERLGSKVAETGTRYGS